MQKPPPLVVLAYRFLGWRVGPRYVDWVLDDITRRGWVLRQGAPVLAVVLMIGGVTTSLFDGNPDKLFSVIVVVTLAAAFLRKSLQQRALLQQGINDEGTRLPQATWYDDDEKRVRRNALSALGTVLLVVGGLTLLAVGSS